MQSQHSRINDAFLDDEVDDEWAAVTGGMDSPTFSLDDVVPTSPPPTNRSKSDKRRTAGGEGVAKLEVGRR